MTRVRSALVVLALTGALTGAVFAQGGTKKTSQKPVAETQAQMQKEAKIGMADARTTALKEVPGGRVLGHKFDHKDGRLVYVFSIEPKGKSGSDKVDVDATTGEMVAHNHKAGAATKKSTGK